MDNPALLALADRLEEWKDSKIVCLTPMRKLDIAEFVTQLRALAAPSAGVGDFDSIALDAAREIAEMWGHDRSQFVSKIQLRVLAAMTRAVHVVRATNYHDAYQGARDDLLEWKRRALDAEQSLTRLCDQINAENGPTHMGEPVLVNTPPQVEYDRGLIAKMLDALITFGDKLAGFTYRSINDQIALLRAADDREAAGAHTGRASEAGDWVLVPREPTDEMLNASQEEMCRWSARTYHNDDEQTAIYKAMLAAAGVPHDK